MSTHEKFSFTCYYEHARTYASMSAKKKNPGGRPTVMTKETISKLEEVFALGGTDKEACFFAGISHQTLYDYQALHPDFIERKEALKDEPILKARRTVVSALQAHPQHAQWYLERKAKKEFAARTEHTGEDGQPLMLSFDPAFAPPQSATAPTPTGDSVQ